MKELEQKADELVKIFRILPQRNDEIISNFTATQCAIQSVNHTIETLERVSKGVDDWDGDLKDELNEQIELKKILEGRL